MKPSGMPPALRMLAVAIAILFGVMTLFAGGRVLLGVDPGYIVFRPLLIYNFTMGFAYIAAGVTLLRVVRQGKYAAGAIFGLNTLALLGIVTVYARGGEVAVDSLRAMTLRTVVWLVIFLIAAWVHGRSDSSTAKA